MSAPTPVLLVGAGPDVPDGHRRRSFPGSTQGCPR